MTYTLKMINLTFNRFISTHFGLLDFNKVTKILMDSDYHFIYCECKDNRYF